MTDAVEKPIRIRDLGPLMERFDVFLVDQFGVLHDGQAPYPGAVKALSGLKAAGKKVALLSNSGKRSRPNESRLAKLGFPVGSWDLFLSSGEVAWRRFAGSREAGQNYDGSRCLLLSRDQDRSAIEHLDIQIAGGGEEADFVLIAGSEGDRISLEDYRALLAPAAARAAPAVCTNPDKIMLTAAGPCFGAGRIAELYEELGGKVTWIGKPFPEIYRAALADLGKPDPSRVVALGDSVEHDVAGAIGAGLAAALVRSGILAGMTEIELQGVFGRHGVTPDYLLDGFVAPRG